MIIIIGAGLSGLLIGYHLKKEGIPFKILEARNRVGGRINTISSTNETPLEMGATWFTNQHKYVIALLEELEINYFEQHMDSTVYFEPSNTSPIQSIPFPNQPPSYRIVNGTSTLINTLLQKLDENDILLNQTVTNLDFYEDSVQVVTNQIFKGDRVVLAIPPKLWSNNIIFEPSLPQEIINIAKKTHTWMEDSIKIALSYNSPFWEQEKTPSTLYSNVGPITELYDHCNYERSKYALCGFINSSFKKLTYSERRKSVINQLKNAFGEIAEEFIDYEECIWSKEKNTFEVSEILLHPHQNNGNSIYSSTFFDNKLFISSAESATESSGYMDGAIYSGNMIAEKLIEIEQQ